MKHAEVESPTMLPGDSLVSLESILCTEELNRRPSRAPDYQADKCALVALAQALADSPRTILQTMAEKMLEIFHCDSAGFSLLTKDGKNFYWPAIAGMWQPHIGGGTPRNFGPCGDVLDCNRPLLFSHWERRYPYLLAAMPVAEEGLLVPFYVKGKAVGTIWAIAHNDRRKFDAEDMRQLVSLGSFASSAYQVVAFLDALEKRDEALRQSCEELEQRVKERTANLSALNQELQAEITERKTTEERLTKTEERLRDVIGNAPVILFSLNRFGVINLSEGKGLDAFGVKPGQLVGQSIFDLYHDSPDLHANARRALSGEEVTFVTEFNNQFFEIHLIPLLDDRGEVAGVTGVTYNITDRRRAERELRLVIDTIPAMSWSTLPDGANDYSSKGWLEYTGMKSSQAVGSGWLKAFHPEDRAAHMAKWRAATNSGELFKSEARILGEDGKYRWFLTQGVPLRDESGKIIRWYGTNVNIDERKRAEEALLDSEEQWKAAFESNPVMYFMLDRTGTTLSVNAFGADQLGYKPSELVGQSVLNMFYEPDREQVRKHVENCFQNLGRPFTWEARKVRKNGTVIWVRETANALLLKNCPVLLVVCEDITDRKRAEEAVRRSEKELRDLIGTIPAMAFVTRPDGSNEFVSRKWIEFSGLSAEQSAGSGWEVTLHSDDAEEHMAKWRAAWTSGKPFESEARHRDAHGNYRWLLVRAVPLRSEQGKILKWYGTAIDIQDRKRAEALLAGEKQLLEMIATGVPLTQILNALCLIIEEQRRGTLASVLLLNADGVHLDVVAGPNLPKEWKLEMEKLPIGPCASSYGTAAYRGSPVIVADIATDPLWNVPEHRASALKHGLKASWSSPVVSSTGKVLGTFCMYYRQPRSPTSQDLELIELATHLARVAIERDRAEEALRTSEQLARSHVEVMIRSLDVLATKAAPEKFIAEMLRTIGQRLHACSVLLWLLHPDDDSLHLRLVIDDGQQVPPWLDHPFVKDRQAWKRNLPFQEMLLTKGPVVCDDVEHDFRFGAELRDYMRSKGRKRFLAIPMFMLGEVRGFIGIQHTEERAYRPEEIELAQALAHHVMIATHEAELGEQRRHAVLLQERTRMARDIHDTLAQGFTGVIIQLDTAVEALRDEEPEAAAKHIRRARDLARDSLTEARRSVHALRPQALEKAEFADALRAIITNTTAGTSLRSDFQVKGDPCKLQPSVEENLLHIGQEALTNALKHACATTFQARLSFDSEAVRLELRDNGKGFLVHNANGGGIGLIGMKERAEQIGATLTVTSKPGRGTTIVAVSAYPAAATT
jgi:PAS domain S-box-containing protein